MTRETQVGLVVASSFLCLLGTVLTLKLSQEPQPGTAAIPPPASTAATATGAKLRLAKLPPIDTSPAPTTAAPVPAPLPPRPPVPAPLTNTPQAPQTFGGPPKPQFPVTQAPAPTFPSAPLTAPVIPTFPTSLPPKPPGAQSAAPWWEWWIGSSSAKPTLPTVPTLMRPEKPKVTIPVVQKPKAKAKPKPPAATGQLTFHDPEEDDPPQPQTQRTDPNLRQVAQVTPVSPPAPPALPSVVPTQPKAPALALPIPPVASVKPPVPQTTIVGPPVKPTTASATPIAPSFPATAPSAPSPLPAFPEPRPVPLLSEKAMALTPPPSPAALSPSVAQAPTTPPAPVPGPMPSSSALNPPSPAAIAPPATPLLKTSGTAQQSSRAESFVEDTYTCRANDTYRTISERFFGTPKYERALQRYNQDFPQPGVDAAMPRAGQKVRVPPIRIMQRRYPQLLDNGVVPVAAAAPEPLARLAAPVSRSPSYSAPTTDVPPTSAAKFYTVREPGETLYEIARSTLGSGQQWEQIFRLNPNLNPSARVPAGTKLLLPPEANVR